MKLPNVFFFTWLASCGNSLVLSSKSIAIHPPKATLKATDGCIANYAPSPENRPMRDIQEVMAVQTLPISSTPIIQPDTSTGSKHNGFRHDTTNLPHPTASKSNRMSPHANVTTANILSSLSRGMSMTTKWLNIRERGSRGDARPLAICIKTTQALILDKLEQLHPDQMPDEVARTNTLSGLLMAIDEELANLQQNMRADGGKKIWDMSRVVSIRSQIMPELEELARLLSPYGVLNGLYLKPFS